MKKFTSTSKDTPFFKIPLGAQHSVISKFLATQTQLSITPIPLAPDLDKIKMFLVGTFAVKVPTTETHQARISIS